MLVKHIAVKTNGKISPSVVNKLCGHVMTVVDFKTFTVFSKSVKFYLEVPISEEYASTIEEELYTLYKNKTMPKQRGISTLNSNTICVTKA